MKRVVTAVLALFLAVVFVGPGGATVREKARSASRVTAETAKKTVRAIERGTKKAAVAVKHEVKKAGRKVKAAAKKSGHAIKKKTTGSGHSKGPNQTGTGVIQDEIITVAEHVQARVKHGTARAVFFIGAS